ncbi:condensation domain-containing protein [Streptosporangium sp. NPDC049046]|uniref:condensation domain-containing protein n=1 Tax=Streptosporangium sp. NPDC049046 TaxID=3155031 RepID=UPI00341BAB77
MSVIKLTPRSSVPVHFSAETTRQGPLTIGQLNILKWIDDSSSVEGRPYPVVTCAISLSGTASVEDVTESLAILIARHEVLRTSFATGPQPCQRVSSVGTLMVDIYSLEGGRANRVDVEAELARHLEITAPRQPDGQRLAGQQLRVALAMSAEVVYAGFLELSHMAVDRAAARILEHELAELISDSAARVIGPPRHQPLDQAELERSERECQKRRRALEYWSSNLAVMPSPLYLTPSAGSELTEADAGDTVGVYMSSPAAALAVQRVSARTRTSRSSCLLAALCAVLSVRTGYREIVFPVMPSNRFERHLYNYVGTLAQTGIAAIDVGSASFDELVRQAWRGMLEGCMHSVYDVYELEKIHNRISHDRGVYFYFEAIYNCSVIESGIPMNERAPSPEHMTAMLSRTQLRHYPMPYRLGTPVRFDVSRLEGEVELCGWSSDVGRVPAEHLTSLLQAVERLLVAAAGGNLDHEGIIDVLQMEPVRRDSNWVKADAQWVELTEIQRLLDDAFAPAKARIFSQVAGEPLVAYVEASDSVRTPEQAHARCMAMLSAHPSAMTPRYYVICEAVSVDVDDPIGWPAGTSAGTGRGAGISPLSTASRADAGSGPSL